MSSAQIIFLDRDGTLIETDVVSGLPVARNRVENTSLLPGVIDGCRRLHEAGYLLILVTNQPDIARQRVNPDDVEEVNEYVSKTLDLDATLMCPHDDWHHCLCRKPSPGLLLRGAELFDCALDKRCAIIGDRWRDVGAGRAAGVSTILVGDDYGDSKCSQPDSVVDTFSAAVDWILA